MAMGVAVFVLILETDGVLYAQSVFRALACSLPRAVQSFSPKLNLRVPRIWSRNDTAVRVS